MTSDTTRQPPSRVERLAALDAMRGIAVMLMIEQHLGVWLWKGLDPGVSLATVPHLFAINALGGLAAPSFITLAGIGAALLTQRATAGDAILDRTLRRRGGLLLGFGLLLDLLAPSWFTWRSWFVLHLMGFGLLTTPLWRRLSDGALIGATIAVLVSTPLLQASFDVPLRIHNEHMAGLGPSGQPLPWSPLRGALVDSQFPIFPWLAPFLLGTWAGRRLAVADRRAVVWASVVLIALGAVLAAIHGVGVPFARALPRVFRFPVPFFPATPPTILVLTGTALACTLLLDRAARAGWLGPDHPLVPLGRASLTLLLLHVPMFREWTRPLGLWQSLDVTATSLILLGVLVSATVLAGLWARVDYRFGAEWWLRALSAGSMRVAAPPAGRADAQ